MTDKMQNARQPWHPERYAKRRPYLEKRQRVIHAIRAYFEAENFAEVDTPALQISPGNEVHLQAFSTEWRDPHGGPPQRFYLHTSPEFAMKKLLVAGEKRLFQLAHVFRNAERSSRHHPEFTMLEWYRAHADTNALMQDCIDLVRAAATAAGRKTFAANGMPCDPFAEWERLSVPDAFLRYTNIDLLATAPDPYAPDVALLRTAAAPLQLHTADDDTWEDIFFRIMMEIIEPHLGKDRPTFLCDYPVSMAALARPKPEDPRLAERFELYIAGFEIANAFGELTDADEQLRRFEVDMAFKEKRYGERFPIDQDFIDALRHGLPPSAGIALGVDRLVMLCAGTENIEDVLWMPVQTAKN
jgi:lysyl-tRNA synthetase class 2